MQALLGVLFHSLGGIAAGSFYMPFNKVKGWAWESYWIIGGLFSWILHMSMIILTANLWGIYRNEWKGVAPKTKWTITWGIIIIILSVFLVGIGNSM